MAVAGEASIFRTKNFAQRLDIAAPSSSALRSSLAMTPNLAQSEPSTTATNQPRAAIDLRSDTVTRPTPEMRRAMAEAEVGDDVYGEDPTVNRLEKRAAEILGKEAALFVPTGTMGNTIAIKIHTEHGQEIICESHSHILDWELSMTAWFSGCLVRHLAGDRGVLSWADIRKNIRNFSQNNAPTSLIKVENTHNMGGG